MNGRLNADAPVNPVDVRYQGQSGRGANFSGYPLMTQSGHYQALPLSLFPPLPSLGKAGT
jgi:hypothetical protein